MADAHTHAFIHQFHNLSGITVKERQSGLYALLLNNRHLLQKDHEAELNSITSSLHPGTHLEHIFWVDVLIFFKQFKRLYQELLRGDDVTISKVLKQEWFLCTAFENLSPVEIVNKVLPTLSLSTRKKVLSKLNFGDETKNDDFFDALCDRYGVYNSRSFLSKCSKGKICDIVTKYPIALECRHLMRMFDQDPNLILLYLDQQKLNSNDNKINGCDRLFTYIGERNPKMYSELVLKYKVQTRLGVRNTKKFVASQKQVILDKPKKFVPLLNKSKLVRTLGSDFKQVFVKLYHKDIYEDACNEVVGLLRYYPKKYRFAMFETTFNSIYHLPWGSNVDRIKGEVLEIIHDPKERQKYAMLKMEKTDDESYLKYYKFNDAFDIFMEKINHLDEKQRPKYIGALTANAILNKDLEALLRVSQLVAGRLKNDKWSLRSSFMDPLEDLRSVDLFEKFGEDLWKSINEIMAMIDVRNENSWRMSIVTEPYLTYLVEHDKPCEDAIALHYRMSSHFAEKFRNKNRATQKKVIVKILETGYKNADKGLAAEFYADSVELCRVYNRKQKVSNRIQPWHYQELLKSLKFLLTDDVTNDYSYAISYALFRTTVKNDQVSELRQLCFAQPSKYVKGFEIAWLLKNDPQVLLGQVDKFFEDENLSLCKVIWGRRYSFWQLLKKNCHLGIDRKFVEHILTKVDEDICDDRDLLVKALSILMPHPVYLKLVNDKYLPTSPKVDLGDADTKKLYDLQTRFASYLKVLPPRMAIDTVYKFCVGDYLRNALDPLYKHMTTIPENEVLQHINWIKQQRAVSFNKHSLHITCLVCDQAIVKKTLNESTDPSSLMDAIRYFVKNPSDDLWITCKSKIESLDNKNSDSIRWVLKYLVPEPYKSQFAELVYRVMNRCDMPIGLKASFINGLKPNVLKGLSNDFAQSLDFMLMLELREAFVRLLIYGPRDLDFFVTGLKTVKVKASETKPESRGIRERFRILIERFFATPKMKVLDPQFVVQLVKGFQQVFEPHDCFHEYVLVDLLPLRRETNSNVIAAKIMTLYHKMYEIYGHVVSTVFAPIINERLCYIFDKDCVMEIETLKLCHNLCKVRTCIDDNFLVINLLPKTQAITIEGWKYYTEVLHELHRVPDKGVQLLLNMTM